MLALEAYLSEILRVIEEIRIRILVHEIRPNVEIVCTFVNAEGHFVVKVGDVVLREDVASVRGLRERIVAQLAVRLDDVTDLIVTPVLRTAGVIQVQDNELRQCRVEVQLQRGVSRKRLRPFVDRAGGGQCHRGQRGRHYFQCVSHLPPPTFLRSKLYENVTETLSMPTNVV